METSPKKKVIYSGIQPTGIPQLGNYIGAIRNWKNLEHEYSCIYCVVDMHSITVRQNPAELRRQALTLMGVLLAVGLDPDETILYMQSHVPAHAQLSWILNCYAYIGELQRMTQFKDKSQKQESGVNAGLLTYPVLMAADILLYQTDLVPIGADQKQHLELSRDLAIRFNNLYSDTFVVPDGYFPKVGARVMSLQDPTKKMSKSDDEDTFIALLDAPDVIARKVKRAVTDSEGSIRYDPVGKPGVSNLLTILCALSGLPMESIEQSYVGKGYGALKSGVADAIIDTLSPIQQEHKRLMADKAYLQKVIKEGAEKANAIAQRTLRKVHKKVGLAPFEL